MRLGKTTLIHFTSNIVVSATGFVATFTIAYLLGPAGLGEYAVATALGFFWLAIPANAITTAIRKRVSEGTDQTAFFTAGLILNGAIGVSLVTVVILTGVILPTIVDPADSEFVRILTEYTGQISALVLSTYAYNTVSGGLQGQKRVGTSGILNALERIGRTVFQISVLVVGYGVSFLILGHALSLVLAAILGLLMLGLPPALPTWEHLQKLVEFAKYAWMGALRSRVFGWMDTIVLSFFVGATLIGIYEAAWGIASLLAAISGSIQRTLFPEVSDLSTSAAYDQVKHYLDEGLLFAGIFVIPGLFGAATIGERVLRFYRPEFAQGAEILIILVLAYGFDVYASQFLNVINATDHPKVAYHVNLGFVFSNLVLNLVLIWAIGWYGAAVATAISALLRLTLGYLALGRLIGRPAVPIREIGHQVLSAGGMAGFVVMAKPIAVSGRVGTLQLVFIGALIYFVVLHAVSNRVRQKTRLLLQIGFT